jgi:hypothetical protein
MTVTYNCDVEVDIQDFITSMTEREERECAMALSTTALAYAAMNDITGFAEKLGQECAVELMNEINELYAVASEPTTEPQQNQGLTNAQNAALLRAAEVLEALQMVIGLGTHSQDAMHLRSLIATPQISLI